MNKIGFIGFGVFLLLTEMIPATPSAIAGEALDRVVDWDLIETFQQVPRTSPAEREAWKSNIENFLYSGAVEFYSPDAIFFAPEPYKARIRSMIRPEFVEVLMEQMIKYFPFTEPYIVGYEYSFFRRIPVYSFFGFAPGEERQILHRLKKREDWKKLVRWISGNLVSEDGSLPMTQTEERKGAVSLVLIKLLLELRLPYESWGLNPQENFTILVAAYRSYRFVDTPEILELVQQGDSTALPLLPRSRSVEYWSWPMETNTPRVKESVEILNWIKKRKAELMRAS